MSRTEIRILQQRKSSSGNQAIVSGGLLTWAHGLLVEPTFVNANMVCITAEEGYVAGDKTPCLFDLSVNRGHSITKDETYIYVRFGFNNKSYPLVNKSDGKSGSATNAKWNVAFEAFA